MKRITAIILLICMVFSFAACADKESTEGTKDVIIEEGKDKAYSTVRKQDYGGYEINIASLDGDVYLVDWKAEEFNGQVLNDLIYKRNLLIQNDYNVTFKAEKMTTENQLTSVRNAMMSGATYDIYGMKRDNLVLAYEGCLYDLSSMSDINLEQEWWDQNWLDAMTVQGSVYSLIGDISPNTLLATYSLVFNKNLFDELGLEHPYELVNSGKWTYEEFNKYTKDYSQDLNEDGKYGTEDQYGLVSWGESVGYSFFYSCDFSFGRVRDGEITIGYNEDKMISIYEKMYDTLITQNNYIETRGGSGWEGRMQTMYDIFKGGRALFCNLSLNHVSQYLSDMEDDFGILTIPKYDADQDEYCHYVAHTVPTINVPANHSNPEMIGNIIEACCAANYDMVVPDLYEVVAKLQDVRDEASAENVDRIIRTKVYDTAHWYSIGGYKSCSRDLIFSKSDNIVSHLASTTKYASQEVKKINDAYKSIKN